MSKYQLHFLSVYTFCYVNNYLLHAMFKIHCLMTKARMMRWAGHVARIMKLNSLMFSRFYQNRDYLETKRTILKSI